MLNFSQLRRSDGWQNILSKNRQMAQLQANGIEKVFPNGCRRYSDWRLTLRTTAVIKRPWEFARSL